MRYKILPRRVTLVIYKNETDTAYSASCQININGSHGTIDTLVGGDFYVFLARRGYQIFKDLGLTEVYAAVVPAHLRLLKRYLKHSDLVITELHTNTANYDGVDIELVWIKITEKSLPE